MASQGLQTIQRKLGTIWGVLTFFLKACYWAMRPPYFWRDTMQMIRVLGVRCFIPVICVVGPAGAVISVQGLNILQQFGTEKPLSSLLAVAMMREISPVLASVMVAAQAGSSIAAELGTMRVKEEIDALEVMAINPIQKLVVPRFIAGLLVTPMLNALATAMGILGGWFTAVVLKGADAGVFRANVFEIVTPLDLIFSYIKTGIYGLLVTVIACYYGYHVKGGAVGVGKAANDTVVHSIILILIANYLLTSFLFGRFLA